MSRAKDCENFVTGDNETEFQKASKFRLVFISVWVDGEIIRWYRTLAKSIGV